MHTVSTAVRVANMSDYIDQVTRELLAVTRPDDFAAGIDRRTVRQLLAEAWALGWRTRGDAAAAEVNPFLDAVNV